MLSPGIRQVTHALLTRPPLTYTSLGFNVSPFDLHVLSTPPAFILSQDQTLMLKSSSYQNYLALLFLGRLSFKSLVLWIFSLRILFAMQTLFALWTLFAMESSGLHYCLFVKVQARQDFVRYDLKDFFSSANQPCDMMVSHQTEKEGFEPSRRY